MDDVIADDMKGFVLEYIDSVAQLEALLLLRANPGEEWDVAKMAQRLYVSEHEASAALVRLCAHGFLSRADDRYSYASNAAEKKALVDRLAEAYARHLVPITNIIHRKPRRIREFADAFKFRRES